MSEYLPPWASIVKQRHAYFFDCFAGAGAYDDNAAGSPLIAGKILLDIQNKYKHLGVEFHIRNVERNEENFQKLATRTATLSKQIDIYNYKQSFAEALPTLLNELDNAGGDRPAFFFIDPFGYLQTLHHCFR